jgi:hypothetical protein
MKFCKRRSRLILSTYVTEIIRSMVQQTLTSPHSTGQRGQRSCRPCWISNLTPIRYSIATKQEKLVRLKNIFQLVWVGAHGCVCTISWSLVTYVQNLVILPAFTYRK